MDAVEFLKTVNRLCKNQSCKECPVCKNGTCMAGFDDNSVKSIGETISKVEQWAKDHPAKTRQSEFLQMFPDAVIDEDDGILGIRPCLIEESIGCTNGYGCYGCRREYWLAPIDESEELK